MSQVTQTAIRATVVESANGGHVIKTSCRDCSQPISLPCEMGDGTPIQPSDQVLKWADLVVCSDCQQRSDERREQADAHREREQRIHASGIPSTFHGLRFDDMHSGPGRDAAIAAAWAWSDSREHDRAGVLIYGPPGTGKTRLAATAVWHRLQGQPVAWCSVANLIATLQAAFSDRHRSDAIRIITGTGALVLDDLDKVKATEWVLTQLYTAIDRRITAGAPLFVTSNSEPETLSSRFGAPIVSRLLGYCQVFELAGVDRRLGGQS